MFNDQAPRGGGETTAVWKVPTRKPRGLLGFTDFFLWEFLYRFFCSCTVRNTRDGRLVVELPAF